MKCEPSNFIILIFYGFKEKKKVEDLISHLFFAAAFPFSEFF